MKLLCAGGGSGGHVYPALAILERLEALCADRAERLDTFWLGGTGDLARQLVAGAGIRYRAVATGPLRDRGPGRRILSLAQVCLGTLQACLHVLRFKPDACLATGGNAAAPGALAARILGIPLILLLPDSAPGITARWLGRLARTVLVTTTSAAECFPHNSLLCGYPVRGDLLAAMNNPAASRRSLLAAMDMPADEPGEPLLVVMGGSQGARSLNQAILHHLPALLQEALVLLVTGHAEFDAVAEAVRRMGLASELRGKLAVRPYLDREAPQALAAADVAVMRAGASILGELPASRTPAVLVPLPIAGGHQWSNARALEQAGACLVTEDATVRDQLPTLLLPLLRDADRRTTMANRMATLDRSNAAETAAAAIASVSKHSVCANGRPEPETDRPKPQLP